MVTGGDLLEATRATPPSGRSRARGPLLLALVFLAVIPSDPSPSVENRTPHALWIRPESGVRPVTLLPARRHGAIDALADPIGRPGLIFRACDYCTVIVEENGRVKVLCSGLASNLCQAVRGGWKDAGWLRYQQTVIHDRDWDPIFARATPRGSSAPE